jgi:hypothetical protein
MAPRKSLIDELRSGGYEAALLTTYSAYLPFYEDVVLRRLMASGVRHNVLVVDQAQYSDALQSAPPRLAGRRYTLLPIQVPGAFHPKLIFLAGKHKGLVAIGSHNVTIAGFGFNRELTNVLTIPGASDPEARRLARSAWDGVCDWLDLARDQLPGQVLDMALKVKDFAPWLEQESTTTTDTSTRILCAHPGSTPLWAQLRALAVGRVRRVLIAGAFYDQQLAFVSAVQRELEPEEIVLAVEPETVEMPVGASYLTDVRVVRADTLGLDEGKANGGRPGYLHAKGIYIEPYEADPVFASGSANPSRPAWLGRSEAGNVEAMLVQVGETALETARNLGFLDIPDMPPLSAVDWHAISSRADSGSASSQPSVRTGVALAGIEEIAIRRADVEGLVPLGVVQLLDEHHQCLDFACVPEPRDERLFLTVPAEIIAKAAFVQFWNGDHVQAQLLVHHEKLIEELSRTGIQRRFRDALASLDTEAPDIETLLQSVERILFEDEKTAPSATLAGRKGGADDETTERQTVTTLAVDIGETKKSQKARRLRHGSDLSYLLDALIYHLRIDGDQALEELDAHGRNEEEQVGADDEDEVVALARGLDGKEVLRICHRKVRTLVKRMCGQLDALLDGRQSLDRVLVRLTGVLALLRQLRRCDGKARWVQKGETAVPHEQRQQLLERVMYTLFEGKRSLLHLDQVDQDLAESDDIARLKGLLIWLAWDCGVWFRFTAPFMESPEELSARLAGNAMVLALSQVVRSDDVVIDEAKECIGGLSSGELDWLATFLGLASRIEAVRAGSVLPGSRSQMKPGDLAVATRATCADVRIVSHVDAQYITVIALDEDRPERRFLADYVRVLKFSDIAS